MTHKLLILLLLLATPIVSEGASFVNRGLKLDVGETTTSNGRLTLTSTSSQIQRFIGTSNHEMKLPDATTLLRGWWYTISNDSTGDITALNNGNTSVGTVPAGMGANLYLQNNSSTNGSWDLMITSNSTTSGSAAITATMAFTGAAGYGSTDTKIPYFTNEYSTNKGTAYTYVNDATNGLKITIAEAGTYVVSFCGVWNAASDFGITKNVNSTTTAIGSVTASTIIAFGTTGASGSHRCVAVGDYFAINDIIRPQTEGATGGGGVNTAGFRFTITRVE